MSHALYLRIMAVSLAALGILLTVIAAFDPRRTAIDVLARAMMWSAIVIALSAVAWCVDRVAELHMRLRDRGDRGDPSLPGQG